ncbi:hypothetical protein L2E82_28040 [Cichorium intybus]|uniref:Uncharacterized protein n=1 Tax=Cichorium intybus TaxID=13427 RepID=A0ACB9CUN7_CICIN|nr:hypothetical protein L2E82_28040 [Cichorium intybus]
MAAVLLSNTMSQNHNSNANNDVKPTIFHDFLGRECAPVPNCAAAGDATTGGSPSASASRPGGLISSTSDLGSDRQVGSHLEGVPFYGQRSEFSGSEIGNKYAGSKRSNSDSIFLGSLRDGVPQMKPDFPDSSHLMKMLRNVGQEQPMRPILQPGTSGKPDSNPSKWERAIPVNVGPVLQYPPRTSQPVPYPYQPLSNRFKDSTMGTSVISQSAADEGSRTGIKGSGIMNSVNVSGVGEPSTGKQKSGISVPEPGLSTSLRRQGSTSVSRQMTIFYGGQAHVFDDVHPNKADAIMAMAGSSGGSWSTNYLSNSGIKASGVENVIGIRENNTGIGVNSNLPIRDIRRMPSLHGGHRGVIMTDARRPTRPQSTEEKREI